ncbi:hypothetical protein QA648_34050 (plasmid) [Rhizobium sp. CB3171]|uniref:hypothetical protein n=1 Tax=Rhizobium sp. CB3171 TaxID=3039157 RepID=UPI0024B1033C|nr:hypothetical protein [Rhizobium sp. CB3171]WFU06805.1 hypothetical protein QA648_34050 [Rhizobium sp. CB3171]
MMHMIADDSCASKSVNSGPVGGAQKYTVPATTKAARPTQLNNDPAVSPLRVTRERRKEIVAAIVANQAAGPITQGKDRSFAQWLGIRNIASARGTINGKISLQVIGAWRTAFFL